MVDAQMAATAAGGAAEAIGGMHAARAAIGAQDSRQHWEQVCKHLEAASAVAQDLRRRNFADEVREGIEYALTHARVRLSLPFADEVPSG